MAQQHSPEIWPPRFVLNEILAIEENQEFEFKEISSGNPRRSIVDTVEDYAVAFLNAEGGRILWGIRDKDRAILGVKLDAAARDEIRKGVAAKLHTIQPPVDPSLYHLEFHPVEGGPSDLWVIEAFFKRPATAEIYFNHNLVAFLRVNGVKQKLVGQQLAAWIKGRMLAQAGGETEDPKMIALARRIRRIFLEHGVEPSHLARFLKIRKAPFTIELRDFKSDTSLLHWLDEKKIAWIANTFLIRREWIDGEDDRIHERFSFDKQPRKFFSTIGRHTTKLLFEEVPAVPEAYFLRVTKGKGLFATSEDAVYVIVAIPLARFSNDRIIWKYITDSTGYPWEYGRTQIQLRAWARLLALNRRIQCIGYDISRETGTQLEAGTIFLRNVVKESGELLAGGWWPDEYAFNSNESHKAKSVETHHHVLNFLKENNLPYGETNLAFDSDDEAR